MTTPRPKIVTFYAYKGGTGRSTALVHTAWALAREGRRIVIVDLDLAAPSLWSMCGVPETKEGFIEYLRSWEAGESLDAATLVQEIPTTPPLSGGLYLLPAGCMDSDYLDTLESLRWRDVLANRPPRSRPPEHLWDRVHIFDELFEAVARSVRPDAIFLDAPTGFNETSNLALRRLSDLAILIFSPNEVHIQGTSRLVSLLTEEQSRGGTPGADVLCVASTIMHPQLGPPEYRRIQRAFEHLDKIRGLALANDIANGIPDEAHQEPAFIVQDPRAIYGESFLSVDRSDFGPFEDVIRYVRGALPTSTPRPRALSSPDRTAIIDALKPNFIPYAEQEPAPPSTSQLYLRTRHVADVFDSRVVVVAGGKGAGKTALFRHITDLRDFREARIRSVHGFGQGLGADLLCRFLDAGPAMEHFWRLYILRVLDDEYLPTGSLVAKAVAALKSLPEDLDRFPEVVSFLKREDAGTLIDTAIAEIDIKVSVREERFIFCFDGLDSAFKGDVRRRERGLAALFVAWQASFDRLKSLELRIFLRADLWQRLEFPERSHLFGREMRLLWSAVDLWRLVVKRALQAQPFALWSAGGNRPPGEDNKVEGLSEAQLDPYLECLFEPHIWGGKNALSKNWILRRLRDAKEILYPRDIVTLLQEALIVEHRRVEAGERVAEESIVSRQSLSEALKPTSEKRVSAVREEYPELGSALDALADHDTNAEVGELPSAVDPKTRDLLKEAGVLKLTDDGKYWVPDLYRDGLGMRRMGPR